MRTLCFCLVTVVSVWGQPLSFIPVYRFPPGLREYLALTEAQAMKISEQNTAFERWSADRSRRMYEVQSEIGIETARSPLDPAALGLRYAEVEAIRREIADRAKKVMTENLAVLTSPQAMKLKTLEEALKLVSTGDEAQSVRLLPDPCEASFVLSRIPVTVIRDPLPGPTYGTLCSPLPTLGFSIFP